VVSVQSDQRPSHTHEFRMPQQCPVCGSTVVRLPGEAATRCTGGLFCRAQRVQALLHFKGRRAMDIEGLGDKLAEQLVELEMVASPADLYALDGDALAGLERMGERSARNVLASIERSRDATLGRFVFALGIPGVGEEVRGTFAGLVEKIPYLKDLGVTVVELMPVFQYDPSDGNYWGYMPLNFFSPHHGYLSDHTVKAQHNECREMNSVLLHTIKHRQPRYFPVSMVVQEKYSPNRKKSLSIRCDYGFVV